MALITLGTLSEYWQVVRDWVKTQSGTSYLPKVRVVNDAGVATVVGENSGQLKAARLQLVQSNPTERLFTINADVTRTLFGQSSLDVTKVVKIHNIDIRGEIGYSEGDPATNYIGVKIAKLKAGKNFGMSPDPNTVGDEALGQRNIFFGINNSSGLTEHVWGYAGNLRHNFHMTGHLKSVTQNNALGRADMNNMDVIYTDLYGRCNALSFELGIYSADGNTAWGGWGGSTHVDFRVDITYEELRLKKTW